MQLTFFSAEVLPYYTRDDLERLQPLSQSLLDTIVDNSNRLALRPISSVQMGFDQDRPDSIAIFVVENAHVIDYEASTHDGDFAETFRRLQHVCVKYFYVAIRDSPFLRYWKDQETAAFTVMSIFYTGFWRFDTSDAEDYDALDSIVNHLRPRTTEFSIVWPADDGSSKNLKLLARESFLSSLETCFMHVWGNTFPAAEFVLKEPGYANYLLSWNGFDAADAIDAFIESFERFGCANRKLESVCMRLYDRYGSQSPAPKRLSKPTKIERPLPENKLTDGIDEDDPRFRVSQCEMQIFLNKAQWMQMEVYKWTIEVEEDEEDEEEDEEDEEDEEEEEEEDEEDEEEEHEEDEEDEDCSHHLERRTEHILQCLVKEL